MIDSTDHITGKTGLTLTITLSKNGAAFSTITPTVTDRGSGWYNLALTTAHTDTLGDFVLHITATGADPYDYRDKITVVTVDDVVRATTPANTLDVSATGEAGLDFANIKQATGSTTLSNITIPTVTAVTNDVGITQAGADKVWSTTARALTDKANFTLADNAISAAKIAASALNGKGDWLLAGNYTSPPTVAAIATAVWQDTTAGDFTVASSIGRALYINAVPGAAGGHFIAGSNAATTVNFTGNLSGSVGSVTGAVGSVTAAVTLPAIPSNWITAAGITAGALNGKGDWNTTTPPTVVQIRTELDTNSTKLANLDATVSSRLATASYSAPPSAASISTAVWGEAVRSLTDKAGFAPSAADVTTAVWSAGTRTLTSGGSGATAQEVWEYAGGRSLTDKVGFSLADGSIVAATIGAAAFNGKGDWLLSSSYSAPPSAATISTTVWGEATRSLTDKAGFAPTVAQVRTEMDSNSAKLANLDATVSSRLASASYTSPPAAADVADAVWNETLADHLTAGSTGSGLNAASSAGDPWNTSLPGAYGAGTAGNIIGNYIDAAVSTRLASAGYTSPPSVVSIRTEMDSNSTKLANLDAAVSTRLATASYSAPPSAATISTTVWGETVRSLTDKDGFAPSTGDITTAVWAAGTRTLTGDVTLATSQPNYAPAKAGDAMTLSAGAIVAATIGAAALNGKGDWNTTTPPTVIAIRQELDANSTKLANLDASVSSRLASASYTTAPTAADNADAVWNEARLDHVTVGSFGEGIASVQGNVTGSTNSVTTAVTVTGDLSATMKSSVTTAVWDAGTRSLTDKAGFALADGSIVAATIAADALDGKGDWNTVTPPTVIAIRSEMDANSTKLANLDATVSSRLATASYSAPPSAASISTVVWGETVRSLTDKAGFAPSAGDITTAVWSAETRTLTSGGSGATAQEVWEYATRSLTDKTGFSLAVAPPTAAAISTAVWGEVTRSLTDKTGFTLADGSIVAATIGAGAFNGKGDWLLASGYTAPPTVVAIRQEMDSNSTKLVNLDATVSSRLASASYTTPPTAAAVADAVWDEDLSQHLTGGSTGSGLNAASSAGDPWATSLPGAYGAGSAGYIIGNRLDAAVTSRLATAGYTSPPSAATISTAVWGESVRSLTDKAGFALADGSIVAATIGANALNGKGDWLLSSSYTSPPAVGTIADAVWNEAMADHLTGGSTGSSLNAAGSAGDPWATVLPGAYGDGTAGQIIGGRIDAAVSTRLASASYTAPPSAATISTAVWSESSRTLTDSGGATPQQIWEYATRSLTDKAGFGLANGAITASVVAASALNGKGDWLLAGSYTPPPTSASIADAVWNETLTDHLTGGSTGNALNAAGSAGDPWATSLPGAYGAGSAGYIVGTNINATIGSRLATAGYTTPPTAAAIRTEMDSNSTKLANLDATVSSRLAAASYTAPPSSGAIATAVWGNATRTLTEGGSGGATPEQIWTYNNRSLTDKAGFNLSAAYEAAKTAASQASVNALGTPLQANNYVVPPTVAQIRQEMDANSTKLDVAISTRASQVSVGNLPQALPTIKVDMNKGDVEIR